MAAARPGRRRADRPVIPALPVTEVRRGTVATTTALADAEALVLPVATAVGPDEGVQPRTGVADAATRYGIDLGELAARLGLTGVAGEAETVHLPVGVGVPLPWAGLPSRLVLVGIGAGTTTELRRAGAAVARATRGLATVVTTVGADTGAEGARAVVEGYLLGAYRHPRYTDRPAEPGPAERLVLLGRFGAEAVEVARVRAAATWTARTLAATPSSVKSPAWLAERAVELAAAAGLTATVIDEKELATAGFGGIVAVGAGSATPPRLVTVTYEPPRGRTTPRHVVVVGKGITYDTGGLSIKPREAMVPMKTDMTGAAVALATVLGAAAAGVRHRVTALLPLAENAVGAASYRPGDVLTLLDGTTVEIRNTDAEGRLVLADALAAAARLEPDVIVDVATLTGAATLGLGKQHGALYTDDDRLAQELEAAGAAAGEPLWRMPLVAEYEVALTSTVADVCHVVTDGNRAGSITAALFLRRFTAGRTWAHLDIAGPARSTKTVHEFPEGATGFGARVLLEWLGALR